MKRNRCLLAAGICGFLMFVPPFFDCYRNIGNVTGTVLSFLLIMSGLFWKQLKERLAEWNEEVPLKYIMKIIMLGVFLIFGLAVKTSAQMLGGFSEDTSSEGTVVVLGCEVQSDGTPSGLLRTRLEKTLIYLTLLA